MIPTGRVKTQGSKQIIFDIISPVESNPKVYHTTSSTNSADRVKPQRSLHNASDEVPPAESNLKGYYTAYSIFFCQSSAYTTSTANVAGRVDTRNLRHSSFRIFPTAEPNISVICKESSAIPVAAAPRRPAFEPVWGPSHWDSRR